METQLGARDLQQVYRVVAHSRDAGTGLKRFGSVWDDQDSILVYSLSHRNVEGGFVVRDGPFAPSRAVPLGWEDRREFRKRAASRAGRAATAPKPEEREGADRPEDPSRTPAGQRKKGESEEERRARLEKNRQATLRGRERRRVRKADRRESAPAGDGDDSMGVEPAEGKAGASSAVGCAEEARDQGGEYPEGWDPDPEDWDDSGSESRHPQEYSDERSGLRTPKGRGPPDHWQEGQDWQGGQGSGGFEELGYSDYPGVQGPRE